MILLQQPLNCHRYQASENHLYKISRKIIPLRHAGVRKIRAPSHGISLELDLKT